MRTWIVGAALAASLASGAAHASLARNPAGAKNMGEGGALTVDTAAQLEKDSEGRTWVLETGVQYQVSDRVQLLLEAALLERQDPEGEEAVAGIGDTDFTLSWLALPGAMLPVVLGAKAKLPTAGEGLGTGRADFSALVVVARESGELEVALEAEFATFGSTDEEDFRDQFLYTLTAEYGLAESLAAFVEVFGNSAPLAGESRSDAALFGLEADVAVNDTVAPYVAVEADTEGVLSVRAGAEWTW